jgi:hypothetical protein
MTAEYEFRVGGVTTDMVKAVWQEALQEWAIPGSAIHQEVNGIDVDLDELSPDALRVEETYHSFGTTILMVIGSGVVQQALEILWEDVLRERIRRRFHADAGERVE